MTPTFVHLRVHTEYSIVDGLSTIDTLTEAAHRIGFPALAVTDQSNLFAALKFYKAARNRGIKPILGADIWLENLQSPKHPFRLTLLCQNQQGYLNLTEILSKAYLENQSLGLPLLKKEWLFKSNEGLIVLSGAREGEVGHLLLANKMEIAQKIVAEWQTYFPDRFYLELQRTQRQHEEAYIQQALLLAEKEGLPVVATHDVCFLEKEDFEAHEARVCIQKGWVLSDPKRLRSYSEQQYLSTPREMEKLFSDIPEALENTVEIAKRCQVEIVLDKTFLPNFPIPEGKTTESYLTELAERGLEKRFAVIAHEKNIYRNRLHTELQVINSMGFAGYFLIVADFIDWAKKQGIPVGPGRGSGAGSLVAYSLGITDLDPLQYDLLFERFLNPERVSMPDFDIDFCMDKRDEVIHYVSQKYGFEAVAQIITYGTMAARAVVRDVGRVLGYPYGMVDKLAKLIPFEIGITLEKALEQEEELKKRVDQEEEIRTLMDLAKKLEGLVRNAGKHAGGIVIAPSKLTDFTALYCEPNSQEPVTQFDKNDIEAVGLVKFDFLGLRTLTIIDWTVHRINQKRKENNEPLLNMSELPLDNAETYELIRRCQTTAVFQVESRGMRDLIRQLQPDCFEDIIALVALFRPGPLQSGMVEDFMNRKHGRALVNYFHPSLEPILKPTYGIILYQEQVMQIAQVMGGYTLGSADILRRAMGKKDPSEMAKQRAIFLAGAQAKNINGSLASHIYDLIEKFSGYGFNKSHSAAYALLTYQTAWLKTHYPAEFMAAVLSSDMDHTDKVVGFLNECRAMKLKVLPPNINEGHYDFRVNVTGEIIYGLGAIKGLGKSAIEDIVLVREQQGNFKDIYNFCARIDLQKNNRRALEALVYSGALDVLGENRASIMANLENALRAAEQQAESQRCAQVDLFSDQNESVNIPLIKEPEWDNHQILKGEKETLGFYLSSHPLLAYRQELQQMGMRTLTEISQQKMNSVHIAGWIVAIKLLTTKRGDRMAIVTLEDEDKRMEITIFSDVFATSRSLLQKDQLLMAEGDMTLDEFTGNYRILAKKILNLEQARETYGRALLIKMNAETFEASQVAALQEMLLPYRMGKFPVLIDYQQSEAKARFNLGKAWQIQLKSDLIENLKAAWGDENVSICY